MRLSEGLFGAFTHAPLIFICEPFLEHLYSLVLHKVAITNIPPLVEAFLTIDVWAVPDGIFGKQVLPRCASQGVMIL